MDRNEESLVELEETLDEQGKILKLSFISDVVRRDCALLILQAIMNFLQQVPWSDNIPGGTIIRQGLAIALSELGPGDVHLRKSLLETLQKTSAGRQQLLDILPYTMPLNESERDEASEYTLQVLREILQKDSSSLLPIIGCLASIHLSDTGRSEAWKLALISLSTLSDDDLPVIVQSLLRNVSTKEEASQALQAIRVEVNDTQVLTLVANLVLTCLQHPDNGALLSQAYMEIFQKIASNSLNRSLVDSRFLLLDLIVLLDLYQREDLKLKMEGLIDLLLQSNLFPMSELSTLTSTLRPRQRSILQERMQPALLELGLFFVVLPIRVQSMDVSESMSACFHTFLLELHHRLDRYRQEELVRSLLHLVDEASTARVCQKRRRDSAIRQKKALDTTCETIHKIVLALTAANPASVVRFKYVLIERLTSEKQGSGYPQVCSILVTMLNGDGGLDSTELMILLQKLLFSTSAGTKVGSLQENDMKVARGLLLANEMVQSTVLSSNDKSNIFQWVLKVLLPLNRRTVQPRVGSHGIDFLSTWSKQASGSQSQVFQHVKIIMANTALVQVQEAYLQKTRSKVEIAYADIPSCFTTPPPANSPPTKKKRVFLFCVNQFLARRDLPAPSEWPVEVSWVTKLVDSYLKQGRTGKIQSGTKRSNWKPDPWLEAPLEVPIFPVESGIFKKYSVEYRMSADDIRELKASLSKDEDSISGKAMVQDLLKLALALLLSMSLSIVVLRNSHEHFDGLQSMDQSSKEVQHRRLEVLNLLQYQFLKVCDLKSRLELLFGLFSSMSSVTSKGQSSGTENSPELTSSRKVLGQASIQGRMILDSSLNLSSLLHTGVMKTCLVNTEDNKLLVQATKSKAKAANTAFGMVLLLRSQVMSHFVASYSTNKVASVLDPDVVLHTSSFIDELLKVTRPKSKGARVSEEVSQLIRLLSSYLEYSICVVDHAVQDKGDNETKTLLCRMLCSKIGGASGDKGKLVMQLFTKFRGHLEVAWDTTAALQMAEILAMLSQLDPPTMGTATIDMCWRMLHTIYPSSSCKYLPSVSPSFARISKMFLALSNTRGTSTKVLRTSIIKCATSKVKDFTSHPVLRRSLLLLWSLLAHPSSAPQRAVTVFSTLANEIETFLEGPAKENFQALIPAKGKKPRKKKPKKNDFQLPTIPSLNGGTLVVYAEMTVHMVMSSFAVAPPAVCGGKENPFSHLLFYPQLLQRLIKLIEHNLTLFPQQRFVALLLTSWHHLLELSVSKTRECINWRNSQPLLTPSARKAGKTDYASIRFLESFLRDLCSLSVGNVACFCERVRADDDSKNPFGPRKVTALMLAAANTASAFRNMALAHNVVPANDPFTRREEEDDDESFETEDVRGFDQDELNNTAAVAVGFSAKRKRCASLSMVDPATGATKSNEAPEDEEFEWRDEEAGDEDEGTDDYASSDGEEQGFGVAGGGWGSDSESDDSGSLQLESGGLFST